MDHKDLLQSALSSLDGMRPAEPGPAVLSGIEQGLRNKTVAKVRRLPLTHLRLAAAGLALLLTANIVLVSQWEISSEPDEDAYTATSLIDDYNFYSND